MKPFFSILVLLSIVGCKERPKQGEILWNTDYSITRIISADTSPSFIIDSTSRPNISFMGGFKNGRDSFLPEIRICANSKTVAYAYMDSALHIVDTLATIKVMFDMWKFTMKDPRGLNRSYDSVNERFHHAIQAMVDACNNYIFIPKEKIYFGEEPYKTSFQ